MRKSWLFIMYFKLFQTEWAQNMVSVPFGEVNI